MVYEIDTAPKISDKALVLKMLMQVCGRIPEQVILDRARAKGVRHLPEVHMHSETSSEWRLSHGVRGRIPKSAKQKVKRKGKGVGTAKEGDEEKEKSKGKQRTEKDKAKAKEPEPEPKDDVTGREGDVSGGEADNSEEYYGDRSQRLIVFTKYTPLEQVLNAENMDPLFMQLLDCLHDLRYLALIVHRDISITYLMIEIIDGIISLVLNDFDLATFVNTDGSPAASKSSKHRAGTLPFMAYEILKEPRTTHYLRHDLESAFYVAFWCAVKLPFNTALESARREALLNWETGSLTTIVDAKHTAITSAFDHALGKIALSKGFENYDNWLACFHKAFLLGYQAHTNYSTTLVEIKSGEAWLTSKASSKDRKTLNRIKKKKASVDILKERVKFFDVETMQEQVTVAEIKKAMESARGALGFEDDLSDEEWEDRSSDPGDDDT